MKRHFGNRSAWYGGATLTVLLVSAISGCGESSATVTGHVHYKGEAVTAGNVTFYGSDNQSSIALINMDGSYTATKVPLGPVKVAVTTPPKRDMARAKRNPRRTNPATTPATKRVSVPPQYSQPDKSGLELTVKPGMQTFDIDLK